MRTVYYHRHRFPVEIISHCVWLYYRFALSFRDGEEMLAMRGVSLSYETVREWCLKFGQTYANALRRNTPRPGDQWHLDEVFLKINGRVHYLWRAVDQDGDVLDIRSRAAEIRTQLRSSFASYKRIAVCPTGDHHRQAEELQCRAGRSAALGRALPAEVPQQSGRELSSADQVVRASDETVQITRTRATFSFGFRNHYLALSSGKTSVKSQRLPSRDEIEIRCLERGDLRRSYC